MDPPKDEENIKSFLDYLSFIENYVEKEDNYKIYRGKGLTLLDIQNNKEYQEKEAILRLEALIDVGFETGEMTDVSNLDVEATRMVIEHLKNEYISSLDPDSKLKIAIRDKLISHFQNLIERSLNQGKRVHLNNREFTYLCLMLNLVDESAPQKTKAENIKTLCRERRHNLFSKVTTRIVESSDILSVVKQYWSTDKNMNTVKKVNTLINDLKLKSD